MKRKFLISNWMIFPKLFVLFVFFGQSSLMSDQVSTKKKNLAKRGQHNVFTSKIINTKRLSFTYTLAETPVGTFNPKTINTSRLSFSYTHIADPAGIFKAKIINTKRLKFSYKKKN